MSLWDIKTDSHTYDDFAFAGDFSVAFFYLEGILQGMNKLQFTVSVTR